MQEHYKQIDDREFENIKRDLRIADAYELSLIKNFTQNDLRSLKRLLEPLGFDLEIGNDPLGLYDHSNPKKTFNVIFAQRQGLRFIQIWPSRDDFYYVIIGGTGLIYNPVTFDQVFLGKKYLCDQLSGVRRLLTDLVKEEKIQESNNTISFELLNFLEDNYEVGETELWNGVVKKWILVDEKMVFIQGNKSKLVDKIYLEVADAYSNLNDSIIRKTIKKFLDDLV